MATHKLAPGLSALFDLIKNRDYYGTRIADPDAPAGERMLDRAKYVASQAVPFSIANMPKMADSGASMDEQLGQLVGVTPAPKRVVQTAAEELADRLTGERGGSPTRTPEQAAKARLKADIVNGYKSGNLERQKKAYAAYQQAAAEGKLTDADVRDVVDRVNLSALEYRVKHLDAEGAVRVFLAGTPAEKAKLRQQVAEKLERSTSLPEDRKAELAKRLQ
jgi:hypothetical protein